MTVSCSFRSVLFRRKSDHTTIATIGSKTHAYACGRAPCFKKLECQMQVGAGTSYSIGYPLVHLSLQAASPGRASRAPNHFCRVGSVRGGWKVCPFGAGARAGIPCQSEPGRGARAWAQANVYHAPASRSGITRSIRLPITHSLAKNRGAPMPPSKV